MTIQIQPHVKAAEKLHAFMDGDAICITLDDFRDLQNSPAVFISSDEKLYTILRPWVGVVERPTNHLAWGDQCSIARRLLEARPTEPQWIEVSLPLKIGA